MAAFTIVPGGATGNRAVSAFRAGAILLPLIPPLLGCETAGPTAAVHWELAEDARINPDLSWRTRLAEDRVVPPELVEHLCDEFDVVHVRTAAQWHRLCAALALPTDHAGQRPDFTHGTVVGLIARVGRPAFDAWPVGLERVRLCGSIGWVQFSFAGGLYYPVLDAPYFVATYVPGLREARVVQIHRREFIFEPAGRAD